MEAYSALIRFHVKNKGSRLLPIFTANLYRRSLLPIFIADLYRQSLPPIFTADLYRRSLSMASIFIYGVDLYRHLYRFIALLESFISWFKLLNIYIACSLYQFRSMQIRRSWTLKVKSIWTNIDGHVGTSGLKKNQ